MHCLYIPFPIIRHITSMSVILIVGTKCTLVASHAAPWWVTLFTVYADGTDRLTPGRYVTLSARRGQRNNIFVKKSPFFSTRVYLEPLIYQDVWQQKTTVRRWLLTQYPRVTDRGSDVGLQTNKQTDIGPYLRVAQ